VTTESKDSRTSKSAKNPLMCIEVLNMAISVREAIERAVNNGVLLWLSRYGKYKVREI
jgi:hypothetical protein